MVFASSAAAEKSVEGTALKTRTGARLIGADHTPCLLPLTTLFVTEPLLSCFTEGFKLRFWIDTKDNPQMKGRCKHGH